MELALADSSVEPNEAFHHLERAHILGQYSTRDHVRVHWAMLRWALVQRDGGEMLGQILRIFGALSKTALGLIPTGNTGGTNVSPFTPLPLPDDLAAIIEASRRRNSSG